MAFWKRAPATPGAGTLWLVKDDPDGDWWCACPQGIVDVPYHDEELAPTGGSGWLFTCCTCGKAFMFARATRIRQPLDELARQRTPRIRRVVHGATGEVRERVLLAGPSDWLAAVAPMQAGLVEGARYVFFDGRIIPAEHGPVKFRGVWRTHDLPDLPHLVEGEENGVLLDAAYWYAERSGS